MYILLKCTYFILNMYIKLILNALISWYKNSYMVYQFKYDSAQGKYGADVMKVVKSWCNGWATSNRYHGDMRLPCLFGCNNCSDSLPHYLPCPHLIAFWKCMIPSVHEDPSIRRGLINSCGDSHE